MTPVAMPFCVRGPLLGATVAVAIGMALLAWKTTAIGSLLFMNHGVVHPTAVLVERVLAGVLVLAAGALFVRRLCVAAAGLLFVVALLLAWANVDQGGYPFSRFAHVAHAMRIAAPLALIVALLPWAGWEGVRKRMLLTVLVGSTAATFVVHGYEALVAHPWFVDLTIGAFTSTGLGRISQAAAERILVVVGVVDVAVALLLIVWRHPAVAGWMAFWGFFTAALRPLNYGWGAMGEFIVRLPHCLLPLALLLLFRKRADSPSGPTPQPH
ncbi:MAG: hypothetical protein FJ397_09305 [Verrucomicrobia bacterium]|nr:hypothetical protein [Verrucomicrobiota bacterium]